MGKNERLKEAIVALKFYSKLRQKDIASSVETSPTYLSDMMNGNVEVSDSFIERLCQAYPSVNREYIVSGSGTPMLRVDSFSEPAKQEQSSVSASSFSDSSETYTLPAAAWRVIELQAASLSEKDAQMSRLIAMLEDSMSRSKGDAAVRVADATSAVVRPSEVG